MIEQLKIGIKLNIKPFSLLVSNRKNNATDLSPHLPISPSPHLPPWRNSQSSGKIVDCVD